MLFADFLKIRHKMHTRLHTEGRWQKTVLQLAGTFGIMVSNQERRSGVKSGPLACKTSF